MLLSFIFFLLVFMTVGLLSARVRKNTRSDYYLAGFTIKPWLVGLSAMATNLSGYMFIGLIGFTYVTGLSSIWLMFGWIVGDFIVSFFIHKPLRKATESRHQLSYAGVLANYWPGQNFYYVQKIAALLLIFLLMSYASAQMLAGSKALLALINWPLEAGVIVSAIMIALYCWAGGIRASVWTDAAQALVMVVAMALMLWIGIDNQGGVSNTIQNWKSVDGYLNWFPDDTVFPGVPGALLFAVGWLFGGISIIGQPHIMIRFMMLDDIHHFIKARVWYYSWYAIFYLMATGVGMLARLIMPEQGSFDAELALPLIASELLPPVFAGVVLAGLFAATMSTADSLVLSCSSAITQDLKDRGVQGMNYIKGTTIIVTIVAMIFALSGSESVFDVVMFSWSGLGSCFAPLLLIYALGKRPDQLTIITMMISGLAIVVIWRELLGWNVYLYEAMPGIIGGICVYYAMTWLKGLIKHVQESVA